MDTNGDGQLEYNEAEKAADLRNISIASIIEGVFKLADQNSDGILTLNELKEFSSQNMSEQSPYDAEVAVNTTSSSILGLVDKNGDGNVSQPELRVFAMLFEDVDSEKADALFRSMDANNDDIIDGDELIQLRSELAQMIRTPIPGGMIPDANKQTWAKICQLDFVSPSISEIDG